MSNKINNPAPGFRRRIPDTLCLRTIANWQLAPSAEAAFQVELPKLQRGFIWNAPKILDLWDSILRGFPIGSLMVSTVDDSYPPGSGPLSYWLLDGQQRATCIAIGHYNPWDSTQKPPSMWSLKTFPILWIDLNPKPVDSDPKQFHPFLVTQSHPWGYNRDGGVITWGQRTKACKAFNMSTSYTSFDLSKCFPVEAQLPVPLAFLLDAGERREATTTEDAWAALLRACQSSLPESWQRAQQQASNLDGRMPPVFGELFQRLAQLRDYRVHVNALDQAVNANDRITDKDNSLLFVRLNTGGVVLGGEELVFSLFKSAFPEAKDAVENCAAGFMAPSKLFSLLVRLVASRSEPAKLGRPVPLRDFKRDICSTTSLRTALTEFISTTAAALMGATRDILCGPTDNAPEFCLPEALATRTINASPEVFLALLYWVDHGGQVEIGSDEHRQLLGRFTALSWFQQGNTRKEQEFLRTWATAVGGDIKSKLWSGEHLCAMFTRSKLPIPVLPAPHKFEEFLRKAVLEADPYAYNKLSETDPDSSLWQDYLFLPQVSDTGGESHRQRPEANFMSMLGTLRGCHEMLLFAQRLYIKKSFKEFGQWELALTDTNCPWDWDHIYPSAYNRRGVNSLYRDWHNSIGNLRAEGLSENRRHGCAWPTEKLKDPTDRMHAFIAPDIWTGMTQISQPRKPLQDPATATAMTAVILCRLAAIYKEWHESLRVSVLMEEVAQARRPTGKGERPLLSVA